MALRLKMCHPVYQYFRQIWRWYCRWFLRYGAFLFVPDDQGPDLWSLDFKIGHDAVCNAVSSTGRGNAKQVQWQSPSCRHISATEIAAPYSDQSGWELNSMSHVTHSDLLTHLTLTYMTYWPILTHYQLWFAEPDDHVIMFRELTPVKWQESQTRSRSVWASKFTIFKNCRLVYGFSTLRMPAYLKSTGEHCNKISCVLVPCINLLYCGWLACTCRYSKPFIYRLAI